jgi:hypothetical protein
VRLDQPAIGGIQRATPYTQRVEEITEPLQSRARMTSPAVRPSRTLIKITMKRDFQLSVTALETRSRRQISASRAGGQIFLPAGATGGRSFVLRRQLAGVHALACLRPGTTPHAGLNSNSLRCQNKRP